MAFWTRKRKPLLDITFTPVSREAGVPRTEEELHEVATLLMEHLHALPLEARNALFTLLAECHKGLGGPPCNGKPCTRSWREPLCPRHRSIVLLGNLRMDVAYDCAFAEVAAEEEALEAVQEVHRILEEGD